MLITRYEAVEQAGVSVRAIYKQTELNPIPHYFVETKTGWMIDSDHPKWLEYIKRQEKRKAKAELMEAAKKKSPDHNEKLFARAVYNVLKSSLDISDEDLVVILEKIEKSYLALKKN